MDATMAIRIVAGVLCLIVLGVIIARRKKKTA